MIVFHIPNGKMEVDLDVFLKEASLIKVKRMLKQLSCSQPSEEPAHDIRDWLKHEIQMQGNVKKQIGRYEKILAAMDKLLL